VLIAIVLRIDVIGSNLRLSVDEQGYVNDANHILHGNGTGSFNWAPGTPAMFALFAALRGYAAIAPATHSHGIAQYAQLIAEIVTLILVAVLAWRLAGGWAALLATVALGTYPPLVQITRTYLSEPLGGLMLVALVAAVCWARRRGWRALALAGVIAGLACLAREDFLPAVAVLIVALALDDRPNRRRAIKRAAIYAAAAAATLAPWIAYASHQNDRFVTITTGGTDALFIGTYLPGNGNQFADVNNFRPAVCARLHKCHTPPGDPAPMFKLIRAEHPGDTRNQAVTAAVVQNFRRYVFGRPVAFTGLLIRKFWATWSAPWSGGNSNHGGASDTSTTLHEIYAALAWLGLLIGAWIYRRRFAIIAPTAALAVVIFVNDWFGPVPRDTLRMWPLVFLLGAVGLVTAARTAAGAVLARRASPR
jgi:4-amino-4-deoxy-L-arabinose transferase-like glycosyltransferase